MNYLKTLKYYYSLSAIFLTLAFYLLKPELAKAFFCASCTWLIYIYMLGMNLERFISNFSIINLNTESQDQDNEKLSKKIKILVTILAGLRMALIAGIFAVFILKYKLNLIALVASFLLFKLVLFLVSLNYATHKRRNTRQDSTH
ncbi:MAG: hypothetical protein RLZZ361_171 [Cyanobacteriota bacterium]